MPVRLLSQEELSQGQCDPWDEDGDEEIDVARQEANRLFRLAEFEKSLLLKYKRATFASFPATNRNEPWVKTFKGWAMRWQKREKGVLMLGPTGVGKTGMAVAAARMFVEDREATAYFVNVAKFLTDVSLSWNKKDGAADLLAQRMGKVDVLILDDLVAGYGDVKEDGGDASPLKYLYVILNEREGNRLTTIITSNCQSLPDLQHSVGQRNLSRLCGMASWLVCTGQDLREFEELK
jgi:DNA replication protein DnaC